MSLAETTDLFAASGDILPDPGWAAGFTTYTIDVLTGQQMIHRSTTNVLLTPATKDESERLIALADHLVDLDVWLPADAWATDPAAGTPFVASDYLLKVTAQTSPAVDVPPLDRSGVDWPFAGSIEGFGDLVEPAPLGDGSTSHCGVLTWFEAEAVRHALAAAPWMRGDGREQAVLGWADVDGQIAVSLVPLLPDERVDCSVDLGWP